MTSKKEVTKQSEEEEFVPKLESAAQEAAVADGLIPGEPGDGKVNKKPSLRRGKWTTEEESYANRLIYEFKLGLLPLTDGTTLRTFLSKLLNCDPMRISKKFVGQNCIGKQVFRRRQQDLEKLTPEQIETSRRELAELERKFLERVAQTNRSKSGGVKEGKGYEDENGNPILAPWMMPPDEAGELSARAAAHHHAAAMRAQQSYANDGNFQNVHTIGGSFSQNQPSKLNGTYSGRSDLTPMDYHIFSHQGNPNLMSQLVHSTGVPAFSFYPTPFSIPPGTGNRAVEYTNGNEGTEARLNIPALENFPRAGNFPIGWLPTSSMDPSSYSDSRAGGTAVNGAMSGLSQDWPSMGSLFGGAGESMENIAQFLAHYQSQNSDGMLHLHDSEDKSKELEPVSASKLRGEDIGLSLDDPGSASKPLSSVKSNLFSSKPLLGKWQDRVPILDTSTSKMDGLPYSIPHDMAAMAQMYVSVGGQDSGMKVPTIPPIKTEPSKSSESSHALTSTESQSIPRNSSIENFWMLVNMGDLPRPDQGVLSEVVFDYPKSSSKPNVTSQKESFSTNSHITSENGDSTSSSIGTENKTAAAASAASQVVSSSSSLQYTSEKSPDKNSPSTVDVQNNIGKKRADMESEDQFGLSLDEENDTLNNADQGPAQKKIKLEER